MTRDTVLVDILRRSGRFSESLRLIQTLRGFAAVKSHAVIPRILDYQQRLCESADVDLHTIAEAMNGG